MLAPRKRVWNRPSAGHQRIARLPGITQSWEGLRTPHWRSNRRSPVDTPGRLNRNRGRTLRREGTVPRIFKLISVSYGPPVDYAEFLAMLRTRETARGCDRPRDGSNSGPARRAPAAAQRRREWEFALIVLVHRDGRRAPSRP